MQVTVELIYDDDSKNKKHEVQVKGGLKGERLMNGIDKAVSKKFKNDTDWTRWNLVDIDDA